MQNIISFFKSKGGFERVLSLMYDMFMLHDRAFGAIRLSNPSKEEETALSDFFKRDYYDQALIRISLADFERQVQKVFETEISLGDFLAEHEGKPINKPVRVTKPTTFSAVIIADVFPKFEGTDAENWIREISLQTRRAYRHLAEQYITKPDETIDMIKTVAGILNKLDDQYITLADFAIKHLGQADLLDFDSPYGTLFLKALACKFKQPAPTLTDDCINLHLLANIISYGMLSNVTVRIYGEAQAKSYTLENLFSHKNYSEYGKNIYIVEDPVIFAKICKDTNDGTIICPISGFNAAFMYLLKQLDTAFYYSGNMTYKGLEQADKLYLAFGKNFIPWRYSLDDYETILEGDCFFLRDEKHHLAMHNDTLASLLSHLRKTGKTAYSTSLVPRLLKDIRR